MCFKGQRAVIITLRTSTAAFSDYVLVLLGHRWMPCVALDIGAIEVVIAITLKKAVANELTKHFKDGPSRV